MPTPVNLLIRSVVIKVYHNDIKYHATLNTVFGVVSMAQLFKKDLHTTLSLFENWPFDLHGALGVT